MTVTHANLLREIEAAAADGRNSLSDLLRKCQILANRLQHDPLTRWVSSELNGYRVTGIEGLPDYRYHWTQCRGYFAGSYGRSYPKHGIPELAIEEKHRELLFRVVYVDPVARYEALIRDAGGQPLTSPWPADFVAFYAYRLIPDFTLMEAWREIPNSTIEGMLDQIRNRVLSFALEIERENPDAGDAEPQGKPPIQTERVDQLFYTNIFGGSNVVASGNNNNISDVAIGHGDWEALVNALRGLNMPDNIVDELGEALDSDGDVMGTETRGWFDRLHKRMANGSLSLANNVTASAVATLILKYTGIA